MGSLCSTKKLKYPEFFSPKGSNNYFNFSYSFQKIELKLTLRDVELTRYSLELYERWGTSTTILGKTTELDGSNIEFPNNVSCNYSFEKNQLILIKIFKNGVEGPVYSIPLAQIMGNKGLCNTIYLSPEKGSIFIQAKRSKEDSLEAEINISIILKDKKKNIKPYFYLKRDVSPDPIFQNYVSCYKSEVLKDAKQFVFNKVVIGVSHLTDNINNRPFRLEFYDDKSNNPLGFQSIFIESYSESNNLQKSFHLIDFKNLSVTHEYEIEMSLILRKIYRFTDYLLGGMKIALIIGIDFTSSNKPIEDPISLHYWDQDHFNSYESVINTCGKMVAYYDYDQLFPVFGFGAKIQGSEQVNYCFPINFSENPDILTVDSILKEYRNCLTKITFAEPTNFAPLIQKTINMCKENTDVYTYNILMILTDGQISDILDTIDLLVEASNLPLSIIIIGIGGADFSRMGFLDADIAPLINKIGVQAKRDYIQFVEFRKFQNDPQKLASEVLKELPGQVENYFRMKNIQPNIMNEQTL